MVLHEFLTDNRAELIERCVLKVARRPVSGPTNDDDLEHGIPQFLDQLIKTLRIERTAEPRQSLEVSGPSGGSTLPFEIGTTAARHGVELHEHGFTVDQVVHDYGDLCQAITDLAFERAAPLHVDEFRTLNRCLDNAIGRAVSGFAGERDRLASESGARALDERLALLARELRGLIHTATAAVTAIKAGNVGLGGATGAVLDRSLIGLRHAIDRSLADVRVSAGMPARRELISLPQFISDAQSAAALEARTRGCQLVVSATGLGLAVEGDRELLAAAVGNLLQNAFKFTRHASEVSLAAYCREDRVLIEIADHCGGLPDGDAGTLWSPPSASDTSGLAICRRAVEANDGFLRARDLPGTGCVFTIDLPRRSF
jgi:signal transduction histidine kinase